jgi:hypothetical protein
MLSFASEEVFPPPPFIVIMLYQHTQVQILYLWAIWPHVDLWNE